MTSGAEAVPGASVQREVLDAGERLRRLLAMLAYLARVGEAPLAELAERFVMDERTLVSELELAACCGLPPYTPDQLLELVIDDERVVAYGLDALSRPPRLTPDEGFAVAAAARAMLAVPGTDQSGPLATALTKLEQALGADRLQVELDAPEHLARLRRAVTDRELVEIDYLGAKRGGETTRTIEPHAVVALEGRFYLDAYCHAADGWRRFQLDRVRAVRPTGERFARRPMPEEMTGPHAFAGGPSARLALVAVPEGRAPLIDNLAAGPAERGPDGRIVVPLRVGDEHWLGRLLLRLGPDAEVVYPPELAGARSAVASRALARYGRSSS
ncbi:MAG: pafC [Acidimicrobiaceae bacterium]|nr:pafC [Acidimicrobiaceae bacterium]